jgi:hypothetical protein
MAGIGPAPKDPSQRRNKSAPLRGEWVDLPPLEKPVLPDLPLLVEGEWSERTRLTWEAWRSDPVTAQWSPADVAHAIDTICLHNAMTPSSANEIRLRMDGLGLTPKGKRDLRWRVGGEAAPAPKPKRSQAASSRQARLSVVK